MPIGRQIKKHLNQTLHLVTDDENLRVAKNEHLIPLLGSFVW